MFCPVRLFFLSQCLQHVQQRPVHAFCQAISHGMVWSCSRFRCPRKLVESPKQMVIEFFPLVVMDPFRHPIFQNQIVVDFLSCLDTVVLFRWVELHKFGEMVATYQHMFVPPSRLIQVHVVNG